MLSIRSLRPLKLVHKIITAREVTSPGVPAKRMANIQGETDNWILSKCQLVMDLNTC